MVSSLIKVSMRRFLELFVTCAGISAIITLFYQMGFFVSNGILRNVLLAGLAVFVLLNFDMLRAHYYNLENNYRYFLATISAQLVFAAVTFVACRFDSNVLFNWLFAVTKVAKHSNMGMNLFHSVLMFHAVGLLLIVLSPIGMFWLTKQETDDEEA